MACHRILRLIDIGSTLRIQARELGEGEWILHLCIDTQPLEHLALTQHLLWERVGEHHILQTKERGILQQAAIKLGVDTVTRYVGDVARLLPAIEQACRLVVVHKATIRLVEVAVVIEHPTICHPRKLCAERESVPRQGGTETTLPRCYVALTHKDLILIAEFVGDVAILIEPKGISVCRVNARIAVDEELANRVTYCEFGIGICHLVLGHAIVERDDAVAVVREVGICGPEELTRLNECTLQVELDTHIGHRADIIPLVAKARSRVWKRHLHKHIGGTLVVDLGIDGEAVPESEVECQVRCPRLLPAERVIARLQQSHTCVATIVYATTHKSEVLVVWNRGVTRSTCRECNLRVGKPLARRLHKGLVTETPHKAHRPEACPAVVATKARRAIGTHRELGEVAIVVVILATTKEREEAIVRIGSVAPRCGTSTRRDIGHQVVVLSLGQDAECLVVVGDTLLTNEEVEVVLISLREAIVCCICDCERATIG